jgi:hypothetical protein
MKKVTFTTFGNIEITADVGELGSFLKKIPSATSGGKITHTPRMRVFWRDKLSNGYRGGYGELFADRHLVNDHSDVCVHFFAPAQGLGTRTVSAEMFYSSTIDLVEKYCCSSCGK